MNRLFFFSSLLSVSMVKDYEWVAGFGHTLWMCSRRWSQTVQMLWEIVLSYKHAVSDQTWRWSKSMSQCQQYRTICSEWTCVERSHSKEHAVKDTQRLQTIYRILQRIIKGYEHIVRDGQRLKTSCKICCRFKTCCRSWAGDREDVAGDGQRL